MVGELIDPKDWKAPAARDIWQRVMDELPYGDVILLHDSGGNRSGTVEALPEIIATLRGQGYEFATVSSLLGKRKDELMPPVHTAGDPYTLYNKVALEVAADFLAVVSALFYAAIGLGVLRFAFLIYYSSRHHKKARQQAADPAFTPGVSVVIPAYNEEKVIAKTIASVLESTYPALEIIVVNDGSADNTSAVVKSSYGDRAGVILLEKENGGKSSALNLGFQRAAGEIIVAIDADTLLAQDAITLLINDFKDPAVAAVSGNVKIGNVHNLLTKWQHIEYVTGFNLERRAFAAWDCISVVPGAIGAWRKSAVASCGYYEEDTLAEDTDMTLELLKNGYKVRFVEQAHAYTEAPSNLRSFLKQRARWSYGILQCLWKQRDLFCNSRDKVLGFLVLPNMWLFQYVFQALSPAVDLVFIAGLLGNSAAKVTAYYLVFLLADYAASLYAFGLEKEDRKVLVWLFLQRIIYRLLMSYVVIKSLLSALKGIQLSWNKLKRLGNASKPVNE